MAFNAILLLCMASWFSHTTSFLPGRTSADVTEPGFFGVRKIDLREPSTIGVFLL